MFFSLPETIRAEKPTEETRASAVITRCGASPSGPGPRGPALPLHGRGTPRLKGTTACSWPRAWRTGSSRSGMSWQVRTWVLLVALCSVLCSGCKRLPLIRAPSGDAVFDLHGHEGVVRDLVFPQNGTLTLVSSSRDKTLRIWDLAQKGTCSLCWVTSDDKSRHTGSSETKSHRDSWLFPEEVCDNIEFEWCSQTVRADTTPQFHNANTTLSYVVKGKSCCLHFRRILFYLFYLSWDIVCFFWCKFSLIFILSKRLN